MKRVRTVVVSDPLARANVVEALAGPGAPVGVIGCGVDGTTIRVEYDAARTAPELIDALIAVETAYVPARAAEPADSARATLLAARGLDEPALDPTRLIETYLP